MDLAEYVINAVLVEDRRVNDVCAAHGIARSWLCELIAPLPGAGQAGLAGWGSWWDRATCPLPGHRADNLRAQESGQLETLPSAIHQHAGELDAGIPEHDLAAAHRVLTEVTRRADERMQLWSVTRPAEPAR